MTKRRRYDRRRTLSTAVSPWFHGNGTGVRTGEGRKSFPLLTVLLLSVLALGSWVFPVEGRAQENGRKALSSFDRLAEEASYMNKRGEADQVIALLEPHFADKKNDSALFFNELGVAYYRLERYKEALDEFETVLRTNPGDEQAAKFREAIRQKLLEKKKK